MPVINKKEHEKLIEQLNERILALQAAFSSRPLINSSEGIKGHGHWVHPEEMSATVGSATDIRLAINDFKGILSELAKLK